MHFGLKLTERCNLNCKHCMYSCNKTGYGMHDTIILAAFKLFKKLQSEYSIEFGIWGGEPFIDIVLFDKAYQTFKNDIPNLYISTNGTFMNNDRQREYVFNLMNEMKTLNFGEPYGIKVSDTYWHSQARSLEQRKSIKLLRKLCLTPNIFNTIYPEWNGQNPFLFPNLAYPELYIQNEYNDIKDDRCGYNPVGRAFENHCCDVGKRCECFLANSDDDRLTMEIQPNGDIQICCAAPSCVIGNVLDESITPSDLMNMIDVFRKSMKITTNSFMVTTCEVCASYIKLKGDN